MNDEDELVFVACSVAASGYELSMTDGLVSDVLVSIVCHIIEVHSFLEVT